MTAFDAQALTALRTDLMRALAEAAGGPPRPVANKAWAPGAFSPYDFSDARYSGCNTRTLHHAVGWVEQLQLQYANWRLAPAEQIGASTIYVRAAIEYAGAFYPVTFNGGAPEATIERGAMVTSDPVAGLLIPGDDFYVRTLVRVSPGDRWPLVRAVSATDAAEYGGADATPDKTLSGTIAAGAAFGYSPAGIIGRQRDPRNAVALVGDSIMVTAASTDAAGNVGWAERALAGRCGIVNIAHGGDTAAAFVASHRLRAGLLRGVQKAICNYAVNDIAATPNLATIKGYLTAVWTILADAGLQVEQTTITPQSTSTDDWATTANQTPYANSGPASIRTDLNAWIRTVPPPLSGYKEVADIVETARDSGKWKNDGSTANLWTVDGTHLSDYGAQQVAAALDIASFTAPAVPLPTAAPGTPGDVITVTLSTDTSAYADGDILADLQAVGGFFRQPGGRALIQSVTVLDKADQGVALDLLTSPNPVSLGTENAAPSISDANADGLQRLCRVEAADYIDLGGCRLATKAGLGLLVEAAAGSTTLHLGAITRGGTPTYGAADVVLRLGVAHF